MQLRLNKNKSIKDEKLSFKYISIQYILKGFKLLRTFFVKGEYLKTFITNPDDWITTTFDFLTV